MDIALHSGEKDFPFGGLGIAPGIGLLDKGFEIGYGPLHHPRTFYYLGKKHLSFAEKFTNDVHPVHEGALNNLQGMRDGCPDFLCIFNNKGAVPLYQSMDNAFPHRFLPPRDIIL